MAYPSQIRGFLKSRLLLFILDVFCFPPDSTKGNSVVVLEQPSGEFQSPGYPDLDDDMHCTWKINAPPYHRITITFLDFELEERLYCKDEVEIYDGDVKRGTYRGTKLHQQNITSTSDTVSVILISCSTSLLADRRGIRASYYTVYPTTTTEETTTIVNGTFSSQRNQMLSNEVAATAELSTRLLSSNNNSVQGSGKLISALLAGLLGMVIFIIMVILIVKRRKSSPANSTVGHGEANQEQDDLPTNVTEGAAVNSCQLEYDYVQGSELENTKNFSVSLNKNRGKVATKIRSSRLQKKNPISNTSNASNAYYVTDFDKEYSTVSCSNQEASYIVHDNDRQMETRDLDMNLGEGNVINTAYEPYLPHA